MRVSFLLAMARFVLFIVLYLTTFRGYCPFGALRGPLACLETLYHWVSYRTAHGVVRAILGQRNNHIGQAVHDSVSVCGACTQMCK